ncbi:hypothetical protein TCAL_14591 [Tigriopus californicus]|uniref:BHLH domain-containing protein n=2 Tax=Tigriopus californicus TaxID=6832 RepID=A0A553PD76_TIGCA|nr:hypothetical protein TCAL_14591 [Tigriopus californicus]
MHHQPSLQDPAPTPPPPNRPKTEMESLLERHFHNRSPSAQSVRSGLSAQSTESERSIRSTHSDSGLGSGGSGVMSSMGNTSSGSHNSSHQSRRKKTCHEDPMSHRIIEKRRRDRMNNCLADLSRLIPKSYLKKGRGRIEKTEIIEMAIKHMNHLQLHSSCRSIEKCELSRSNGLVTDSKGSSSALKEAAKDADIGGKSGVSMEKHVESFRIGYHECLSEVMHFMVEKEGLYSGDALCVRVMNHLQRHYEKLNRVKPPRQASNRYAGLPFIRGSSSSNSSSSSSAPFTSGSQALPGMGHPGSSLHQSQMESHGSMSRPNSMMSYQMNSEGGSLSASDSDYGSVSRPSDSSEFSSQPYLKPKALSAAPTKDRADSNLVGETADSVRSYSPSYEMEDDQSPDCQSKAPADQPENLSLDNGSFVSSHPDLDRDHAGCYKFKETIRQRFSDEYGTDDEVHRSKRARLESTGEAPLSVDHEIKHERKIEEEDSMPSSTGEFTSGNTQGGPLGMLSYAASTLETHINETPPRRPPHVGPFLSQPCSSLPSPQHASKGRSNLTAGNVNKPRVPIFALHPRGTYYIPLSIDHSLIAPYLVLHGNMDEPTKSSQPSSTLSSGSPLVLHPITINVNFCGPFQSVISLGHPMTFPAPTSEHGARHSAMSESQSGQNPGSVVMSTPSAVNTFPTTTHRTSRTVSEPVPQWRERLDQILSPNKPMHLSGNGGGPSEAQLGK